MTKNGVAACRWHAFSNDRSGAETPVYDYRKMFDTRTELDGYLKTEPYIEANVWEKVDVEDFNVVILGGEKVGK